MPSFSTPWRPASPRRSPAKWRTRRLPAFDRDGKYLYFIASTNAGATSDGLDMTSDLYKPTSNIYAAVLASSQASPIAPELDDEKSAAEKKDEAKKNSEKTPAAGADAKPEGTEKKDEAKNSNEKAHSDAPKNPSSRFKSILPASSRASSPCPSLPLSYIGLATGNKGSIYFLKTLIPSALQAARLRSVAGRWKTAKRRNSPSVLRAFELSANGEKMLLAMSNRKPNEPDGGGPPSWVIVPANAPVKPGEGVLSFADMKVHVDPAAEWMQMYHEVWRIERAYFYDPHFHGTDTVADEKRFEPYVASIASRADLNYIFQEMLGAFSVGHLRGNGGVIPTGPHVPGGLLGADYSIVDNRYCLAKIYTGGKFNPEAKAPLAQPGPQPQARRLHPQRQWNGPRSIRRHSKAPRRHRGPCHQPARL